MVGLGPIPDVWLVVGGATVAVLAALPATAEGVTLVRAALLRRNAETVAGTIQGVEGVERDTGLLADRYRPSLLYAYEFDGEKYLSEVVFPAGPRYFENRRAMERIVDRATPGEEVQVHVDPGDPGSSYLYDPSPSLHRATRLSLTLALLGVLVAAVGLL